MDNYLSKNKCFLLLSVVFLWLMWGCTEAKESQKKEVKRKIIQSQPIPPSKTVKKSSPPKKVRAVQPSKSASTTRKTLVTEKSAISDKKIEEKSTKEIKKKPEKAEGEEKKKVAKEIEKIEIPYVYNPKGRSDPFRPFITEVQAFTVARPKGWLPRTPLERSEISEFKLVAILLSEQDKRAMVEDGTGKGYIIKIGTYIGKKGGKVTDIFADHVVVEEQLKSIYGDKRTNRIPLKLRKGHGTGGRK